MEPSRHDGLAQLHQRYYAELVRLAFVLTGDWSLAEELVQEAFVRAWRSWGSIQRQQSAPAYLRATVINLARTSPRTNRVTSFIGLPPTPTAITVAHGLVWVSVAKFVSTRGPTGSTGRRSGSASAPARSFPARARCGSRTRTIPGR